MVLLSRTSHVTLTERGRSLSLFVRTAIRNRLLIANVAAFGACVGSSGAPYAVALAIAYNGMRAPSRIEEQGFEESIGNNAPDAVFTGATSGLVRVPGKFAIADTRRRPWAESIYRFLDQLECATLLASSNPASS
jgi:hypothetical protein